MAQKTYPLRWRLKQRARWFVERHIRQTRRRIKCHNCGELDHPDHVDRDGTLYSEACPHCETVFVQTRKRPDEDHRESLPINRR